MIPSPGASPADPAADRKLSLKEFPHRDPPDSCHRSLSNGPFGSLSARSRFGEKTQQTALGAKMTTTQAATMATGRKIRVAAPFTASPKRQLVEKYQIFYVLTRSRKLFFLSFESDGNYSLRRSR